MVATTTKKLTPDDLYRMPDADRYELIGGQLVERDVSNKSSKIGARITTQLDGYCERMKSGWVFGADQGFVCFPDDPFRVRKPDSSCIVKSRMTVAEYEQDGYCPIVPDLVAEVISPNDTAYDVENKRDEWLAAGVKLVWIIKPERKTVAYHHHAGQDGLLRITDTLSADPILPGFSVPVAELFTTPYS